MARAKLTRTETKDEKASGETRGGEGFRIELANETPAAEPAEPTPRAEPSTAAALAPEQVGAPPELDEQSTDEPVLALQPAPMVRIEHVPLARIERAPELNCRASGIRKAVVAEYSECMRGGAQFPPVVLFRDGEGKLWLADGHHRCAAAELAERTEIAAEVREGGRREALLHAARANSVHGLRRTNRDKWLAAQRVIGAFPAWGDRRIAEAIGTSHPFVGKVRARLVTVTTHESGGAKGKDRRGKFNAERELTRLAERIDGLISEWPRRDAEGRAQLAAMLTERVQRLAGGPNHSKGPEQPKQQRRAATKAVRGSKAEKAA